MKKETIKELKKLLKELQKEGDKLRRPFRFEGSYDEGYWDGLRFVALLIDKKVKE